MEQVIDQYRQFFEKHLINVKDRAKAYNEIQKLCVEYGNQIESGQISFFDTERNRLVVSAENVIKEHFSEELLEEFNKKIKQDVKRFTDDSDHWGWVLLDIFATSFQTVEQSARAEFKYQNSLLILIRDCLRDYGLHTNINKRNTDIYTRYHIHIEYQDKKGNWCDFYQINLTKNELVDRYINPYLTDGKLRLEGKIISPDTINGVVIKHSLLKDEEIHLFLRKYSSHVQEFKTSDRKYYELCPNITDVMLSNAESVIKGLEKQNHSTAYVHESRLDELEKVKSGFDLAPLVQLCKELNLSWSNGHFITIPMQVRTIMNFVPPIFGCKNFAEVANNYSAGGKSFKGHMGFLHNSLKHVADGQLHMQASKKQALPNSVTVDYSSPLDALLAQVINVSQ